MKFSEAEETLNTRFKELAAEFCKELPTDFHINCIDYKDKIEKSNLYKFI